MRSNRTIHAFLLFIAAGLFIMSGCKKEEPDNNDEDTLGEYYIRFKVDGVQKVFEEDAISVFNASNSDTLFSTIMGANLQEANTTTNSFAILLGTESPVKSGDAFVNISPAPSGYTEAKALVFTYTDNAGTDFGEIGDAVTFLLYGVHSETRLEITELKNNYAKGTFSALLFDPNVSGSSAKRVRITDGKFYLKRY